MSDPRCVEEVFDLVADLPPDEAARRLEQEPAEVRAAVESLLAHDRAAPSEFLTLPAKVLLERDPTRLGRFYVLRRLGEGGMGVVYLGYDEVLDRRVALKLLRPGLGAHDWLLREAQALGRLAHPNVVAVHEVGEHQGRPFLAMELVDGPTLAAWLAAEPRPFSTVLPLLLQAGRALGAAHQAGLVHRDFKPENVLISDGRPRVVDFGIAALAGQSGVMGGTPGYMAPEQLRGEPATAASDQYAFAVTLRRLPNPPSWLAPLVERAHAADPSARFPSMTVLLDEIQRHLPRDPDFDPSVAGRTRALIACSLLLVGVILEALIAVRGAAVLLDPRRLALVAAVQFAVCLACALALRRRLFANRHGRQIVWLFAGAPLALVVHRLVEWRLGTPATHIVVGDLLLLAVLLALAAVTIERWLGWGAAILLAASLVGAWHPPLALHALAFSIPSVIAFAVYFWGRR
jgi:eukaryotic-like serine/threonine-protein kinase